MRGSALASNILFTNRNITSIVKNWPLPSVLHAFPHHFILVGLLMGLKEALQLQLIHFDSLTVVHQTSAAIQSVKFHWHPLNSFSLYISVHCSLRPSKKQPLSQSWSPFWHIKLAQASFTELKHWRWTGIGFLSKRCKLLWQVWEALVYNFSWPPWVVIVCYKSPPSHSLPQ